MSLAVGLWSCFVSSQGTKPKFSTLFKKHNKNTHILFYLNIRLKKLDEVISMNFFFLSRQKALLVFVIDWKLSFALKMKLSGNAEFF